MKDCYNLTVFFIKFIKMKETIKKSLVGWLVFSLTVVSVFLVYATIWSTWTNPWDIEASSWTTLTSANWNKMLANMNSLSWSLNNLNDRINTANWVLDTSWNWVLFSIWCEYKFEILNKWTTTITNISYNTAISSDETWIQYIWASWYYYRILYNEKNKYYQNWTTWTHDIWKIWKKCN